MMEINKIIEALKSEANRNPASNAAFHVFALRQRSRETIRLNSLYNKMKKEGFNFARAEYTSLIKLLGDLGLGTIEVNRAGRIVGLKHIKSTLQSIGAVACGQRTKLTYYKVRNKFTSLVVEQQNTVQKEEVIPQPLRRVDLSLELSINNKVVKINVPKELTKDEVAILIGKLQSA